MKGSSQTHVEDFQLSTSQVKIDWRKPIRLPDTEKHVLEVGEGFISGT